ncbi:MAG: hypothetical protein ABT02_10130 [Comamonadaceae bacterium SCN 68-20]|nr:hypothetical protein [Comamonadaceae bacterium]ODU59487.1 MAG: hypothetical protein ABT02_10130 [Comamonadaceae bacterium SCN 68-20]OJX36458.1 MAG: hypothetical protein BGO75_16290 [Burkholderiales bacterium 68-20]
MLPSPVIEEHAGVLVVRDDLLPGGTKMRALLPLMQAQVAAEFVYASPAQGYAQVALAHCARLLGRRATVFTAARKVPHPLTVAAADAGAAVVLVPCGYLSVVQARARAYAAERGAHLVPFGADAAASLGAIAEAAAATGLEPAEVWSVAGSGVLTRALQRAWPRARFVAVVVGREGCDTGRARRIVHPLPFERAAKVRPPFPSAPGYDAKAWEYIRAEAGPGALFWNVGA